MTCCCIAPGLPSSTCTSSAMWTRVKGNCWIFSATGSENLNHLKLSRKVVSELLQICRADQIEVIPRPFACFFSTIKSVPCLVDLKTGCVPVEVNFHASNTNIYSHQSHLLACKHHRLSSLKILTTGILPVLQVCLRKFKSSSWHAKLQSNNC